MAEALSDSITLPLAPLVAIVGPTASGKSSLGVWLAERLHGEILACDSTQIYRGLDIGTAKPSRSERRNIPHHLMDLFEPNDVCTAGEYRTRATAVLDDLRQRKSLPILTAGTGLYLRALLDGLSDAPVRSESLRKRLTLKAQRNRPGYLHRVLVRMDPVAAKRISPQDTPKLIRAIEVGVLTGKPITDVHQSGRQKLAGFRAIKIGLNPPRTALYERIEHRTLEMVDAGWLEEVKALISRGVSDHAKPFMFIGYRELHEHLQGKKTLEQAIAAIQQATRRYAKRQLTWFRKEAGVQWFEGFGDEQQTREAALEYLRKELSSTSEGSAAGPSDTSARA